MVDFYTEWFRSLSKTFSDMSSHVQGAERFGLCKLLKFLEMIRCVKLLNLLDVANVRKLLKFLEKLVWFRKFRSWVSLEKKKFLLC